MQKCQPLPCRMQRANDLLEDGADDFGGIVSLHARIALDGDEAALSIRPGQDLAIRRAAARLQVRKKWPHELGSRGAGADPYIPAVDPCREPADLAIGIRKFFGAGRVPRRAFVPAAHQQALALQMSKQSGAVGQRNLRINVISAGKTGGEFVNMVLL